MAIKVVVFDYDLTLYSTTSEYHNIWNEYTSEMLPQIFGSLNQAEFNRLLEAFEIQPPHSIEKVARACLYQFGSAKPLVDYLFTHPYNQDYKNMRYIDNETIAEFASLANLYILSNAPANNIARQLSEVAHIDTSNFKSIYTNPHNASCPDKAYVLRKIIEEERVKPNEVLMVGDSLTGDIMPAKNLGLQTYQVTKIDDLKRLLSILKQENEKELSVDK